MMQISTEVVGDVGVIRVRGELDHVDAPRLDEAATQMLGDGARSLVIDCGDITFMDSAGLHVLVRAYEQAHQQGGTVTVRRPSAFIERLLQITGLDTVLVMEGLAEPDRHPIS